MDSPPIATIAALIGDPARALMLSALMDGRAYTASELADIAGVTRQTASAHLAKLTDGALLTRAVQGRHRYFRIDSPDVASALESLMVVGNQSARRSRTAFSPERTARTCYDHIAGKLGVDLFGSLCDNGHLEIAGAQTTLSMSGHRFMDHIGINVSALEGARRPMIQSCLDWSERKDHLSGSLGAALLQNFLKDGWLHRTPNSRALSITFKGALFLRDAFGIRAVNH